MRDHGIKPYYEPQGAFYMLIDAGAKDTTAFCLRLLNEKHVAVAPGDTFGSKCEGYVRIALA